ncbi:PREDICTED: uncharacterized protein LOC109463776 isoform X2 [Branchiostoma belcheri]|uniref:Uncharacterized protein LOC109463776 isoform X2 n=1 Tax=Branchiostoma belcheri TaxID=7741 RepID=A0A6P4Y0P6_BRABE|nr:PREDICTED: uncharacterized protein LOC109463776 isoform X2 [Branchiostoma belcheri]
MDEKTDCKEETGDASCVAGATSTSQVAEEGIQSTPHTQHRHTETEEVTFKVKFDFLKPSGYYRQITAQGSQRILDALQDEPSLHEIKNNLTKAFLDPTARSKIRGEPNIGSPCSIVAGGWFKARLNTKLKVGPGLSVYRVNEIMSKKRCRFYIDVSEQTSKSKWITKLDPIKFHRSILLIDCLPNDTLLSALLRDGRIVVSKVKYCQLLYKDNSVVQLTDKVTSHHDHKFVCSVGASPEVTDNVWKEALAPQHNNVPIDHTVDGSPSSESRICSPRAESPAQNERLDNSGPTPEVGNISPLANNIMEEIYNKWQSSLTDLLGLDLQPKTSAKGRKETMRRNNLDKFAKPFLQEYLVDTTKGTPFVIMQKFMSYAYSVGILLKDGHPYGTCFRVGPKFVLTNRHVTNMAGLSTGSCSGASVVFNYIEQCSNDYQRCKIQEIRHSHNELDYSVLELEPLDDSEFPPGLESLIWPTTKKSRVSIIGHPGGDPKTFAIRCPIVNSKYNEVIYYLMFNPNPTGGADYSKVSDPARATYRTDFAHGSSGSPGFDQNGKLIVMHTCGYPLYSGSKSVLEQGIRMTAIYRDLKQNKPDLFREIFPQDLSDAEWPEPEQPMDWS